MPTQISIKTNSTTWVRPSDWLPIDSLVSVGDHKFVALMAVWSDRPSYWTFNFGQAYTVRIDGVATNYGSSVQSQGSISYASLSPTTTTSEGFRQAIIEVYPQVAPANTAFTLTNPATNKPTTFPVNFIDVRLSFPNITSMFMNGGLRLTELRKWTWLGIVPVLSRSLAFNSPYLEEINEDFSTSNGLNLFSSTKMPRVIGNITNNVVTGTLSLVSGGWGNITIGNLTFNAATTGSSFISTLANTQTIGNISGTAFTGNFTIGSCFDLRTIGTINIPLVSSLTLSNIAIETIGNITTSAALTSLASAFQNSRNLRRVHITDCSGVTNTTSTFLSCNSLQELYLGGLTRGITIPPCLMDDTAFAAFFTSLGTASGAQTIVITGNITLSAPTLAIATGKGYTVTP